MRGCKGHKESRDRVACLHAEGRFGTQACPDTVYEINPCALCEFSKVGGEDDK
jgi:hypothetical protein